MADPDEPSSLRALFLRAQALESSLSHSSAPSNSPDYQATLRSAIAAYASCQHAASSVALFSPNESLDDLSTSDLPYLSIAHHVGNLTQKTGASEATARRQILKTSQGAYDDFLHLLSQYGILPTSHGRAYARFREDRDSFSVVAASDPAERRNAKIARVKEERGLRARLEALRRDPAALGGDEEALRGLRLAELQLQAHETFQALDLIAQELRILAMAPDPGQAPADARLLATDHRLRTTGQDGGDGYSERLDGSLGRMLRNGGNGGPILDARGRPMQPFVLMDRRQELRDGVFRPGHRLPTMSIDEYLEEERRRGGIIEGGGEPPVVEPDEDNLEKADAETMKKREWDEFVEENPRGSGNTINRG